MTLKERVESYVGTVTAGAALNSFLQAAAQTLIDLFPMEMALKFTRREPIPTQGLGVANLRRVIQVEVGGVPAVEIPAMESSQAVNSGSLKYRTSLDPVFYLKDGSLFVIPSSASNKFAHSIPIPTLTGADEGIQYFPGQLLPAVAIYAAVQVLKSRANAAIGNLASITIANKTVPSAPSVPSYTWNTVALGTLDETVVSAFTGAPIYSPGSFPTLASEYTNIVSYLETQEDIELGVAEMKVISAKLEDFAAKMQNALNAMQASKVAFDADVSRLIHNADLAQQRLTTLFAASSDRDMQNAIQSLQVDLAEYRDTLALYGQRVQAFAADSASQAQTVVQQINQQVAILDATTKLSAGLNQEYERILLMTGLLKNEPPANG